LATPVSRAPFWPPPAPGRSLALLWGAKDDRRFATLTVNGQAIPLQAGGYTGFRWLLVPLPAELPGDRYEFTLAAAGEGRPAFLAEIRLLDSRPTTANERPAVPATLRPLPTGPNHGEAFPAMRGLWDTEPTRRPTRNAREQSFRQAEQNARAAAEALYRCRRYVDGWLAHADPRSGLIPRGLNPKALWQGVPSNDLWNGRDAAADNYAFMVLTCALTDTNLLATRMRDMLRAESTLARRVDRLSDNYRFSTATFLKPEPVLDEVIFDNAEYVKDGLLPITEWLGPSPWSRLPVFLSQVVEAKG
jgi:hypothetical protein